MLVTFVRKSNVGYMGFVRFMHDGKPVWQENTGIIRLNKKDALKDAETLKADYEVRL